ncbi:MAG: GGDEF domain-containing protein [Terriglobia bacterium]
MKKVQHKLVFLFAASLLATSAAVYLLGQSQTGYLNSTLLVLLKVLSFAIAFATILFFWWRTTGLVADLDRLHRTIRSMIRGVRLDQGQRTHSSWPELDEHLRSLRELKREHEDRLRKEVARAKGFKDHLRNAFREISQAQTSIFKLPDLLEMILEITCGELDFDRLALYFTNGGPANTRLGVARGFKNSKDLSTMRSLKIAHSLAQQNKVISGDARLIFPALSGDTTAGKHLVSTPLSINGQTKGTMIGTLRRHQKLKHKDMQLLRALADQAAIAIQNAQYFDQLEQLNLRDNVTRLHNHRFFHETLAHELRRADRSGEPLAVLILDVDDFEKFNREQEHHCGDMALREIGEIIISNSRGADVVARYGGGEFAAVLPGTSEAGAKSLGERIAKGVSNHRFEGRGEVRDKRLTLSGGISLFPRDGTTAEALVDRAHRHLDQAKSNGRNRVCPELSDSDTPVVK